MIDGKDLQQGNWVTCYNHRFQVGIIEEDYVEPIGRNEGIFSFEELEPIPLSPDILISLGFEVIDDNPKKKPHYDGDVLFKILDFEFTNSMIDGFVCYSLNDGKVIYKYVHELQNLVKILTGTELTFNQQ